jgi:hypothetical protein
MIYVSPDKEVSNGADDCLRITVNVHRDVTASKKDIQDLHRLR